jgi:hypothetical protein
MSHVVFERKERELRMVRRGADRSLKIQGFNGLRVGEWDTVLGLLRSLDGGTPPGKVGF